MVVEDINPKIHPMSTLKHPGRNEETFIEHKGCLNTCLINTSMTIGRILHEQPADNLAEANDKDLDEYILKIQICYLKYIDLES